MALNFQKAAFVRSAADKAHFLRDGLPQFAFAGRSNVGKSSVINRLLGRKNLAYVGASPGKTTQINYFLVDSRATWWTCRDTATRRSPGRRRSAGAVSWTATSRMRERSSRPVC